MQEPTALVVRGVSKRYGPIEALHPLDLEIPNGSVFALLGSNGAGKTTFMKSVLGLVRPDAGKALILGRESSDPRSRRSVRYLPESVRFSGWATPLFVFRQVERIRRESGESDLRDASLRLGCADLLGRPFGKMSQGQIQRSAIAIAASGSPAMLFLDEPSNGLDPEGRILLRNMIRDRAAAGATVILNSHLLGEVEAVCDSAAFLREGRIAASGEIDSLLRYKGVVRIQSPSPGAVIDLLAQAGLVGTPDGPSVVVPVAGERDLRTATSLLAASEVPFTGIQLVRESLEDLFLRIISRQEGGDK